MAFPQAKPHEKLIERDMGALGAGTNIANLSIEGTLDGYSTGYPFLDWVGGVADVEGDNGAAWKLFPRGSIVEVAGLPQSSKTTLILETIAYNQSIFPELFGREMEVAWVDVERTLTKQKKLAEKLGVSFKKEHFWYVNPITAEGGLQHVIELCKAPKPQPPEKVEASSKKKKGKAKEEVSEEEEVKGPKLVRPDIIVIDTLAAMRPAVEEDNQLGGTKQPAIKAKIVTEFFRNVLPVLEDDGPCIVFINQLYEQIGGAGGFNQKVYDSACSKALAFYASARYRMQQLGFAEEDVRNPNTFEMQKRKLATINKVTAEKSKFGSPYREASFINWFGSGVNPVYSLVSAAKAKGKVTGKEIIQVAGSWLSVLGTPGDKETVILKVQGEPSLVREISQSPEVMKKIAENLSPTWVEQVRRWLKHPKHHGGASTEDNLKPQDISALDSQALVSAFHKDEQGKEKRTAEEAKALADKAMERAKELADNF